VRVDSGVTEGSEIPQSYDSLIAKLVCWGADRDEAIARTLRALGEMRIDGVKTTIPFHRWVLGTDWFRESRFSTSTVERLDLSGIPAVEQEAPVRSAPAPDATRSRSFSVEIEGKRFRVRLADEAGARRKPPPPDLAAGGALGGAGETLTAPMQGTIVKTLVAEGSEVAAGDGIAVLEAMKMENQILCHRDGVVKELRVEAGDAVQIGTPIAVIGPAGR
jgi:acetyl-CoA/propionyl-CoA carboxylase biotin carboxyl carrier protein